MVLSEAASDSSSSSSDSDESCSFSSSFSRGCGAAPFFSSTGFGDLLRGDRSRCGTGFPSAGAATGGTRAGKRPPAVPPVWACGAAAVTRVTRRARTWRTAETTRSVATARRPGWHHENESSFPMASQALQARHQVSPEDGDTRRHRAHTVIDRERSFLSPWPVGVRAIHLMFQRCHIRGYYTWITDMFVRYIVILFRNNSPLPGFQTSPSAMAVVRGFQDGRFRSSR